MAAPVKICYVVDNLAYRGGERTFLQLVRGLPREEFRMSVACSPGGYFVERLREEGVEVLEVDMRRNYRLDRVFPLARELRRIRPRIVHTQGRGDPFGRAAAFLARVPLTLSTVAMIHNRYVVPERWRKAMYRVIDGVTDPMVDHWIVVNQDSARALVDRHRVPRERISVIYNGIEPERFQVDPGAGARLRGELGLPEEGLVLGGLGALTGQKGFDLLLEAFAAAGLDGASLVVGGEGEDRKALEEQARGLGLDGRFFLPGFMRDVASYLAALDVFVLSSRSEGHPMVLLEAMAAGRPVVAVDIPGVRETVEDGVSGILVPQGDPGALAEALSRVAGEPELREGLGRGAAQRIQEEFSVSSTVSSTRDLYRRLLDVGGASGGPS